ncbi:hypothetical protein Tco_1425996 [Tanacetum coccineum]
MWLAVMSLKNFDEDETIHILARRPIMGWQFGSGSGWQVGGSEESDAKFEELKQLILGTSTHVDHVPQTTKVAANTAPYVPQIRRGYDDIGLELLNSNAESSTTIGKNLRPKSWDVKGSNKLDPRKTNDMIGERFKPSTDFGAVFVEGMQPTYFKGFGREFGVGPQAAVDREM